MSFMLLVFRSQQLFCELIQQACEKIDRTRAHAGEIFAKLLYHRLLSVFFANDSVFIMLEHCHLFTRVVCTCVHCSPEVPNIPHKAELQSVFPRDEMEYFDWKLSSDTFPKFAKLLSLSTYTYYILLGLTVSAGGLTESLVRFHLTIVLYYSVLSTQ